MKIAQLIVRFWPAVGGAEEHCLQICKRLVRDGHEVIVYTSNLESEYPWKELKELKKEYKGIKIKHHKMIKLPFYPLMKGLKIEDCDLIHTHAMPRHYTDIAARYARKKKIPLVISTVGLHFHEGREGWLKKILAKLYYLTLGKRTLKQASAIHCFSKQEKKYVEQLGIKSREIKVIPSGINLSAYKKKRAFSRKDYLLFIGRIDKGKGLEYLVKALKGTKEKLIIIGKDFGCKKELEKLVKKLKVNVEFKGYVSEQEKIGALQHCKALILPSKYESFGRVLVEAMACGKPVIATRVGGIPDFVKEQLVPYGDVNALRKAIKNIKPVKHDVSAFDWKKVYERTKKIYLKLLS